MGSSLFSGHPSSRTAVCHVQVEKGERKPGKQEERVLGAWSGRKLGTGGKAWMVGVGAKFGRKSIDWLDLLCIWGG